MYYDSLMLTLCVLFWPYHTETPARGTNNANALETCIKSDLLMFPLDVVVMVQEQMKFVTRIISYSDCSY